MSKAALSIGARWRYAAKLRSWPKLFVPAALGQALGFAVVEAPATGALAAVVFGAVFTVFELLAIVFLNDWGDRRVDTIKRRMFPAGGSPKTIPDGILPVRSVLLAGLVALAMMLATAGIGARVLDRPHLLLLGLVAAGSLQIYTFAPVRLNYRGGGELVEAFGVGVILPCIHAYAQSGLLWDRTYVAFLGFTLLSLASALASGLSDEESDRAGGKRTFTTMFGNCAIRRATGWSVVAGIAVWLTVGLGQARVSWTAACLASAVVGWHASDMQRLSPAALTNAFAAQGRYKRQLHLGIWRGATVFAVLQILCSDAA